MEGAKIKNIVIVILLLLNVFLLFLVGGLRFENSHSHETARDSAIQVVRNAGIQLEESTVPREMALERMQAVRDLTREQELAVALLGGEVSVEARGGEVYRYQNGSGWIQFHSTGEFAAEFQPNMFPLEGQSADVHGANLLQKLDFQGQVLEDDVTQGKGSITFRQSWQQILLLGCQVTLDYRDGCLLSMTNGRRLLGEPRESTQEETPISVATALMWLYNGLKDLGDIYTHIERIEPAYTMTVSLSGPARLTPVWYVRTNTGTYQMDTQTGQISRSSSYSSALAEP